MAYCSYTWFLSNTIICNNEAYVSTKSGNITLENSLNHTLQLITKHEIDQIS